MTAPTVHSPPAPPTERRPVVEWIALLIVIGVLVVSMVQLVRGPHFVHQVRVANRSNLQIDVDVTGANRDGWLSMAIARPNERVTTRDVVEQGDSWIFRFRASGHEGGEVRVSRERLVRAGWTIEIPDRVIDRLEGANAGDL
jgi:hypothetical protein